MDKRLKKLILDYQASVRTAVEIIQRSGIQLPASCYDWIRNDIPKSGKLEGDIHYLKHGIGCKVELSTGPVDFDFGRLGEIDEFDSWRLIKYAETGLTKYGFENSDVILESFKSAVKSGSLMSSGADLYYVADSVRSLAIEVCKNFPNDALPHRDQDPVMILYTKCFLAADLMRKNHEKLLHKWDKNNRLSQNDKVDCEIYFLTWLAYLGATCEGFNKLNMYLLLKKKRPESFSELISKCGEIGGLMKQHAGSLREFRNNVFHLRDDIKPLLRFAADDQGRLSWAEELHTTIADFLSDYRVLCEVHYVMQRRESESQLRKRKPTMK